MHMTYEARRPATALLLSALALALAACDGDLGKDSAGDTGVADDGPGSTGSATATSTSGASADASASADGGGSADSGGAACDPEACGPAPGADPMCEDGSSAQWSCVDTGTGCGWQGECPGDVPCSADECGPGPGEAAQLCPDGVNYSGPGPCVRSAEGVCGWTYVECPACCDPTVMPDCLEPITCCADGSWSCGDAATCEGGLMALECEVGGTDSGGTDSGGTDTGGMCVQEQGSCAAGETCCLGLDCCAGVPVPPGQEYCGMECPISDVNAKENFAAVDVRGVLEQVRKLDITTWNYKTSPDDVRHLGPMAQDFKAAFSIGSTDKAIFQVDADGVALASIQALDTELQALRTENAALKQALEELSRKVDAMK